MHLGCGELRNDDCMAHKLTTVFASERILKIGYNLAKLRAKAWCLGFLTHSVVNMGRSALAVEERSRQSSRLISSHVI